MLERIEQSFDALCLPDARSSDRPERPQVRRATAILTEALEDPAFVRDCIALEHSRLDAWDGTPGLRPFHVLRQSGVTMAFGYFAPGQATGAHEHTSWTVTAVCHNDLEVLTFDRDVAYGEGRLVVDKTITATPGRVGHIYDPCIHEARNPTGSSSVTMHLLSPNDGQPPADKPFSFNDTLSPRRSSAAPLPDRLSTFQSWRRRQSYLRMLASYARARAGAFAPALLEDIASRGTLHTKAHCDALLRASEHVVQRATWRDARLGLREGLPSLEVREQGPRVELVCTTARGERVLLRFASWARAVLDTILGGAFTPRALPCGLEDDELFALIAEFDEWGFLDWKGQRA